MRITIVGGGNIGTQFAVHCAYRNHKVVVYTSKPELFHKHLNIVDENGNTTCEGDILYATNDPEKAFRNTDCIIVTMPPTLMDEIAEIIYLHSDNIPLIGVVPGNGGSECAFAKCIKRGNTFFGIERVPAIARLIQKGKTVKSTGYREELHVSALPIANVNKCCVLLESIFDMPCKPIQNYLNLTMTPSNPILHTTRLRTLFEEYKPGMYYDYVPLFYEEWDDKSSRLLIKCDEEVQMICRALPQFHLENVISLRKHYESPSVEAMTKKISSIPAFKGLTSPTIEIEGKYIPDLHSRYFTSDFSYGLAIIKQIAEFSGVETPNIDETIHWYKAIAIESREFNYGDYGIINKPTFEKFYSL